MDFLKLEELRFKALNNLDIMDPSRQVLIDKGRLSTGCRPEEDCEVRVDPRTLKVTYNVSSLHPREVKDGEIFSYRSNCVKAKPCKFKPLEEGFPLNIAGITEEGKAKMTFGHRINPKPGQQLGTGGENHPSVVAFRLFNIRIQEPLGHAWQIGGRSEPIDGDPGRQRYIPDIPPIVIEYNDWKVELKLQFRRFYDEKAFSRIGETLPYFVTYVGYLYKLPADGPPVSRKELPSFSVEEAAKFLENFAYLISYYRGSWTPPMFPSGYDQNETCVWKGWDVDQEKLPDGPPESSWSTFFNPHRPETAKSDFQSRIEKQIGRFSSNFLDNLYEEEIDLFRRIILKYLTANKKYGEGTPRNVRDHHWGIVSAQKALEGLYVFKKLGEKGKNKIPGYNIYKSLFEHLDCPSEFVPPVPEIIKFLKDKESKKCCLSHILNDVRNTAAHFERQNIPDKVLKEALNVYLWFIEMLLFKICEFKDDSYDSNNYSGPAEDFYGGYWNRFESQTISVEDGNKAIFDKCLLWLPWNWKQEKEREYKTDSEKRHRIGQLDHSRPYYDQSSQLPLFCPSVTRVNTQKNQSTS